MSCERNNFTIRAIKKEQEWLNICLSGGLSLREASHAHGAWGRIPLEAPPALQSEEIYIFINEAGMEKYGFPEGSANCKIAHEKTEARLCQRKFTRAEAHSRACEAELQEAQELGILEPYFIAEMKACLHHGLLEEAFRKTRIYLTTKRKEK